MDRIAMRFGAEGLAPSLGQAKQAHEHGGHPLAMGDGLGFEDAKGHFRVEVGQDLRRTPEAEHHIDVAEGRAVVERRRGEIHGVLVQTVGPDAGGGEGALGAQGRTGLGRDHALGSPRGAGGKEQGGPFLGIVGAALG